MEMIEAGEARIGADGADRVDDAATGPDGVFFRGGQGDGAA
jgi:hypothetical protein